MTKIVELNVKEKIVAAVIAALSIIAALALFKGDHSESIPVAIVGLTTAGLGFLAYDFSKAKFRLDLFEKRWLIYEELVQFLSLQQQTGSHTNEALAAAQGCFRGKGYHKSKALFGDDIIALFERLNSTYSWLAAYQNGKGGLSQEEWARLHYEHSNFLDETVRRLPEYFKGYIYFGDYKR